MKMVIVLLGGKGGGLKLFQFFFKFKYSVIWFWILRINNNCYTTTKHAVEQFTCSILFCCNLT